MREILFRGKTISTDEWVHGGYAKMDDRHFIAVNQMYDDNTCSWGMYEVYPESIGQYIDDTDAGGNRIFEGDIVYVPSEDEYANIFWNEDTGSFILGFDCWCGDFDYFYGHELEIHGNTYDNKEWFENGRL
jgi:hypothetical protein